MRFESKKDLDREQNAISLFLSHCSSDLVCKKLGPNDVDFSLIKSGITIAFVEVKGRNRNKSDAFPLPIAIRKLNKLQNMGKGEKIIIWDCYDAIICSKISTLRGVIRVGGRKPRYGSFNDIELMAYFSNKSDFLIIDK